MRFTASLVLAAAAVVPAALAQSTVTINSTPLTQCATSTFTMDGTTGPYYVAVVPASDPCTEDAFAEFYDVESGSQDYYCNLPSGTSIQVYVQDVNGVENWSQIYTVGDGDNSCLGGSGSDGNTDTYSDPAPAPADDPAPAPANDPAPAPANDPAPAPADDPAPAPADDPAPAPADDPATSADPVTSSAAATTAPAPYVPPSPSTSAAAMTYGNTGSSFSDNSSGSGDTAPANAASEDSSANGASSLSASVTLLVGAFAAVVALF